MACGSKEFERPLSRFPLRGQAGAGGFPPRREHGTRQQKALACADAAGSPHKRGKPPTRGASPPCGSPRWDTRNFRLTETGLLMEAAHVSKRCFWTSVTGR